MASVEVEPGTDMPGIDLIDANLLFAVFIALLAGMLSFISPCVLPIVPPYLAYLGGVSFSELSAGKGRRTTILAAASFALGLSTIFMILGFTASVFGAFFLQNQVLFGRIAGAAILVFGLHFLGVFRIPILDREASINVGNRGGSVLGAYVLGLAFAFGWVPCIGPQLGAILSLAAQEESVVRGTVLLGMYAVGLGLPFVLAAVFISRSMRVIAGMRPHMRKIEIGIGALLSSVGILLLTGKFSAISYWLLESLPFLAVVG